MKILVVGNGGREHALCWKLAQSPLVSEVHCAPGNGGTEREDKVTNHPAGGVADMVALAKKLSATFTLVGPEQPLSEGIVDAFMAEGLSIIGPRSQSAMLETSKYFAKQMMLKAGIPTARFSVFTDAHLAKAHIKTATLPIVIKADGLASGKGVVVATTMDEALGAITHMMIDKVFGEAGRVVVIEDCVHGEEASFIVLTDGKTIAPLNSSQDHKRLMDGDKGPNTGGMGAYSPAPIVNSAMQGQIVDKVITPIIRQLSKDMPYSPAYRGFLYAGVMINSAGVPQVLEFNCRLGDPETQPLMFGLNADLASVLQNVLNGSLSENAVSAISGHTIGVVLASGGYPASVQKGAVIHGLNEAAKVPDVKVFHAGTTINNHGEVVVSGGRVLCVTARGATLKEANAKAYHAAKLISFEGMQMRTDIGHRALR